MQFSSLAPPPLLLLHPYLSTRILPSFLPPACPSAVCACEDVRLAPLRVLRTSQLVGACGGVGGAVCGLQTTPFRGPNVTRGRCDLRTLANASFHWCAGREVWGRRRMHAQTTHAQRACVLTSFTPRVGLFVCVRVGLFSDRPLTLPALQFDGELRWLCITVFCVTYSQSCCYVSPWTAGSHRQVFTPCSHVWRGPRHPPT